jgi:hypothetical protein
MFLDRQSSCGEFIECCPGIVSRHFLTFTYNFRCPNDYRYDKAFHDPHSLNFYTSSLYYMLLLLLLRKGDTSFHKEQIFTKFHSNARSRHVVCGINIKCDSSKTSYEM